ncbi:MAG: Lrp/AsnC family transcriptional regulator [Promethearchaeota archaeon]
MITEVLKIDEVDKKIIQIVQDQPHLTHTEIATRVNRSQPTVGMRIKRLEESGVLKYQAGINIKSTDLYYARVEIETKHTDKFLKKINKCPLMLNAFKLNGVRNLSIILASFNLENLDRIVNYHFRNNPDVISLRYDIIVDVLRDFVLPFNFQIDQCKCPLKSYCSIH